MHQRSHDPQLREQLANAYFRLGDITRVIGSAHERSSYYRSVLDLWEPLAASDRDNLEFQSRVADCDSAIGKLIVSRTSPNLWSGSIGALKIYERIADPEADRRPLPGRASPIAAPRWRLYLSTEGSRARASPISTRPGRSFEKLVDSHPDQIDFKKDLAEIVNRMGYVDFRRRDYRRRWDTTRNSRSSAWRSSRM